jgi:hypothetical protein
MRHSGTYRRLYDLQFIDAAPVVAGNGEGAVTVEGIA